MLETRCQPVAASVDGVAAMLAHPTLPGGAGELGVGAFSHHVFQI